MVLDKQDAAKMWRARPNSLWTGWTVSREFAEGLALPGICLETCVFGCPLYRLRELVERHLDLFVDLPLL